MGSELLLKYHFRLKMVVWKFCCCSIWSITSAHFWSIPNFVTIFAIIVSIRSSSWIITGDHPRLIPKFSTIVVILVISHSRIWSTKGSHFRSIPTLSTIGIIIGSSQGLIFNPLFHQNITIKNIWPIHMFSQVVVFIGWCFSVHCGVLLWINHWCMLGHQSQCFEKIRPHQHEVQRA